MAGSGFGPSGSAASSARRAAIEDHVLHLLEQIFGNVFVDDELTGIDDAHVEAGFDCVEEKRRVNRLANHVVAAEGKRQIADPAADLYPRTRRLDLPRPGVK